MGPAFRCVFYWEDFSMEFLRPQTNGRCGDKVTLAALSITTIRVPTSTGVEVISREVRNRFACDLVVVGS